MGSHGVTCHGNAIHRIAWHDFKSHRTTSHEITKLVLAYHLQAIWLLYRTSFGLKWVDLMPL